MWHSMYALNGGSKGKKITVYWSNSGLVAMCGPRMTNSPTLSCISFLQQCLPLFLLCCCCYSVTMLCLTLCDPMDCSTPGFPVLQYHPEMAQTHVHWVGDGIQPSHPLSSPSPAFSLSQYQGLLQWFSPSHQVAHVLELWHQSFQWIFRTDFL